jgi:hypothetical protein
MPEGSSGAGLPRRGILRALALAPAALAGCAAATLERGGEPAAGGSGAQAPAAPRAPAPAPAAVAALRGFRLPPEAEPAAVFRATGARPGDPR